MKFKLKYFIPLIVYGFLILLMLNKSTHSPDYDGLGKAIGYIIALFFLLPLMIINYLFFFSKKIRNLNSWYQLGISILILIVGTILMIVLSRGGM